MVARTPSLRPPKIVPVKPESDEPTEGSSLPINDGKWWARYRSNIVDKLSPTAISVLEADASYVVERALPRVGGELHRASWPETRVRTGMVVGSVQSGKTASMLGVAAMALDAGADLLVLLAGTRVGLWLQTYERLLAQLDGSTTESAYKRRADRLILPQPEDILYEQRADPTRYLQRPLARQALRADRPIICVVPKEDDHLLMLRRFLADVISEKHLDSMERPYSIVVLDDEADDASVLDSDHSQKLTPRLISSLWSGDPDSSATRHKNMLGNLRCIHSNAAGKLSAGLSQSVEPQGF